MKTLDRCTSVVELSTELCEGLSPVERQRLVDERSELRQSLRGLDDQRAALVRKITRLERELGMRGETGGAP